MYTTLAMMTWLLAMAVGEGYPDDAYSRPAIHRPGAFEDLCLLSIGGGDPVMRAEAFEYNRIAPETHEGVRGTRWRFLRRPEPAIGAALNIHQRLRRKPDAISATVVNESAKPLTFSLILTKMPWEPGPEMRTGTWIVAADEPAAPGAETRLVFDLRQAAPAGDTKPDAPVYPASYYIRADNAEAGPAYNLFLHSLEVRYPAPEGVDGARLSAPKRTMAGDEATFTVTAADFASRQPLDLELCDGARTLARFRLNEEERADLRDEGQAELTCTLPWCLPGRELEATLVAGGYRVPGASAVIAVENQRRPGFPEARLEEGNGLPRVTVNGEPFPWTGYASYDFQPGNTAQFGASGANVFVIPAAAGQHTHKIVDPAWTGYEWDFGDLEERVGMALQANPAGYLELRLNLALPPLWVEEHRGQQALVHTDGGDIPWTETGTQAVSIASETWLADQTEALRRFLAYCEEQPWAGRVIMVVISGQVTEEWFAWACNSGYYGDYSPPMQAAFAAWCEQRGLPFDGIPDPSQREQASWDWFPNTEGGRAAAAYAQFLSDVTAETIGHFAEVVKESTQGRLLTGALHGYVIQLAGEPRQHLSGHFAMPRLLDDPNFDLFMGIPLHNYRLFLNGYDAYTTAARSVHAADKLYLNENDLFSWLHQGLWYHEYDPEDPRRGAIRMHRRVFANDMVHGAPRQWFSLFANWHDDPQLQAEFARQIGWQQELLNADRTPAEEVALVVDDASFAWMPPGSKLHAASHPGQLYALARTGAPVGVWLLRDLDKLPERIRLVFVSSAAAARSEDLDKLRRLIERGGRTIVVAGAPGLIDREAWAWDAQAPAELLDLPLRVEKKGGPGLTTGPVPKLRPRVVGEGAAESWAQYGDGTTGTMERPLAAGGQLIWCGAPINNPKLLRHWLDDAAVTCIAPPGYTVHASKGLVAVTTDDGGDAGLRFPRPVKVRDVFTGWKGEGQEFTCPFAPGQTRLFEVK